MPLPLACPAVAAALAHRATRRPDIDLFRVAHAAHA
ncbi:hypothetical protein AAW51_5141 [Caldimonas brevitalea]|uniref:Uncharacterized protein n=1 Tax=Caldimonas brevitalea TaxID=413882 RepID=A0A0G3BQY3_9BURK|nr:hypothetical protein AAW51_5141 [Caldimonas brevitalea]